MRRVGPYPRWMAVVAVSAVAVPLWIAAARNDVGWHGGFLAAAILASLVVVGLGVWAAAESLPARTPPIPDPTPSPASELGYLGWAEVDQGGFMVYLEFPQHLHEVACSVRTPTGGDYWADPKKADKTLLTTPSRRDPRGSPCTAWFFPTWFLGNPPSENGAYDVTWHDGNAAGPVIERICVSYLDGVVDYAPGPCLNRAGFGRDL